MDLSLPSGVTAEEDKDVLGGGGVLESGIYKGVVEMVYMTTSAGGARGVTIHFNKGGQIVKNNTWISTKPIDINDPDTVRYTYHDTRSGTDKALPGYSQMNAFFLAVTGKGIVEQKWETKTVGIYSFEAKGDVNTDVPVAVDALDKELAIGILKISEEKTTAASGYKDGTGEFRDSNEFNKYFSPVDGSTAEERAANITGAVFFAKWKAKNDNKTRVKKAKNSGAAAGATAEAPAKPSANVFA
jgi:hypothetical protein